MRFVQQLTPEFIREKWTLQENKNLFCLYRLKKNHWKEISKSIPGRTDNSIKNQFFALLRKGLRKACRSVGLTHNTMKINTIKPKVLLEFFDKSFSFVFKDISRHILVSDFIERFALLQNIPNSNPDPQASQIVNELISSLTKLKLDNK